MKHLSFFLITLSSVLGFSQTNTCDGSTLNDFFGQYDESNFSSMTVEAITAAIAAEDAVSAEDYITAQAILDTIFNKYPMNSSVWSGVNNYPPFNINFGRPHAYAPLTMLREIVQFRLNPEQPAVVDTVRMKVVLIGKSAGIKPNNLTELQNGTGSEVTNLLDNRVSSNDYCVLKQSSELFFKYVNAITNGKLYVKTEFVELPNATLDVSVNQSGSSVNRSFSAIRNTFSNKDRTEADWWWWVYPSHRPQEAVFDDLSFTGTGIGTTFIGGPELISTDRWFLNRLERGERGDYTDIERRLYLPRWFQHEFYHHFYNLYEELGLEDQSHQWFDRSTWPADFVGNYEIDYYDESLQKRLKLQCSPLSVELNKAAQLNQQEELATIDMSEIIGDYKVEGTTKSYQEGEIYESGGKYYWKANSGHNWELTPDIANGRLISDGSDLWGDTDYIIKLHLNADGEYSTGVQGIQYSDWYFKKQSNMLRSGAAPIDIANGNYGSATTGSLLNEGSIIKENSQFFWTNTNGDKWSLTPDYNTEEFTLGGDSPYDGQVFELEITEENCGLKVTGFRFQGELYEVNNSSGVVTNLGQLLYTEDENSEVYPNPTPDKLYISYANEGTDFVIYNMRGKVVVESTYSDEGIDITNLSQGLYMLKIKNITTKIEKF